MREYRGGKRRQGGWYQWAAMAAAAVMQYLGTKETNETNQEIAAQNREFQASQTGTAYQRAVADMQAAGLNPMLAYSQGGAQSGQGSMPAPTQNTLGAAISGAGQAVGVMREVQNIAQSESQANLLDAEAARTRSETYSLALNTAVREAQLADVSSAADLKNIQYRAQHAAHSEGLKVGPGTNNNNKGIYTLEAQARAAMARAAQIEERLTGLDEQRSKYQLSEDKAMSEYWDSPVGRSRPYLDTGLDVLRGVTSAAGATRRRGSFNINNYPGRK